ncbi:MAG TPA: hypothetical protein PKG79_06955 [Propioniciclava tarda]|nr:hypothetical protein [Propioniciclava tarda]
MAEQAIPATVRTSRVRVRRNVRWLAAGILAVVLGGLGTWALFATATDTRSAIKVTTTVHRGQVIDASKLAVIPIGRNADVAAIPGEQLNSIVGQTARTDLPGGGLLVAGSFGPPELAAGLARVGVKVESGRLPASPLAPGTLVLVVALPGGAAAGADATLAPSVEATLATAPAASPDGGFVVDLNVPLANAEQVARLGAMKQIAIIQKSES